MEAAGCGWHCRIAEMFVLLANLPSTRFAVSLSKILSVRFGR